MLGAEYWRYNEADKENGDIQYEKNSILGHSETERNSQELCSQRYQAR